MAQPLKAGGQGEALPRRHDSKRFTPRPSLVSSSGVTRADPSNIDVRGVACRVDGSMWGRTGPPKSTTTTTCALSAMPIGPGNSCAAIRPISAIIASTGLPRSSLSGMPVASSSHEPGGAAAAPRPGTSTPFVDPRLPVLEAPVTWLPSSELPVMAARADQLRTGPDADFRADAFPGLASIHVDAVGRQHVVIKSSSRRVTICFRGAPVAVAPARVTFEMPGLTGLFAAQRNVAALQGMLDDAPMAFADWGITALEKRDALIALDAYCNGASHRDVAILIYGAAKVDAEWVADGCDLKDYVRRCRSRGVRLMEGGYRGLLR